MSDDINWSKVKWETAAQPKLSIWRQSRYVCPRHGDIGSVTMQIQIHGEVIGTWCLRCYGEMLDQMGVCRVKEVEKPKEE
jgi:hypothetical protein